MAKTKRNTSSTATQNAAKLKYVPGFLLVTADGKVMAHPMHLSGVVEGTGYLGPAELEAMRTTLSLHEEMLSSARSAADRVPWLEDKVRLMQDSIPAR